MSDAIYFKCACDHCGGRIEFPSDATGASINCPHCDAKTTLAAPGVAPPRSRRVRKRVVLPIVFALIASAVVLSVVSLPRALIARDLRLDRASTNSPGSISGVVENTSSRARRNVRVEIDLLNSRGETLWQATDYTPEIAAKSAWHFRALVVDPNVVTGKVARVRVSKAP